MADAGDDLFLFGDDFEAILDLLDEDEALPWCNRSGKYNWGAEQVCRLKMIHNF